MTDTFDQIINTEAGLVSSCLFKLPNRPFIPKGLYLTALEGDNLDLLGCSFNKIKAGGIGFSPEHSYYSSLGEFCERYSSGIVDRSRVLITSYDELIKTGKRALHPNDIKLFTEEQYSEPDFPFEKLQTDHELPWIQCFDYYTDEAIYIPNFLVYFGKSPIDSKYSFQTSTGLACGDDFESAFKSAVFENFERHAFVNFWHNQNSNELIKYDVKTILETFPENKQIRNLVDNNNVHISIFDMTKLSHVESIVVIMYFKFKGKYLQTMGSSSRFTKEDALIKALLEAYQGVEYAIGLDNANLLKGVSETELEKINDYEKHFAYYNAFPHLREKVPMLKEALYEGNYASEILFEPNKLESVDKGTLKKAGIENIFYVDLTTSDVAELGNKVVRVIMPEFALLSAMHSYPYLGNEIFKNKEVYNELPHPFP